MKKCADRNVTERNTIQHGNVRRKQKFNSHEAVHLSIVTLIFLLDLSPPHLCLHLRLRLLLRPRLRFLLLHSLQQSQQFSPRPTKLWMRSCAIDRPEGTRVGGGLRGNRSFCLTSILSFCCPTHLSHRKRDSYISSPTALSTNFVLETCISPDNLCPNLFPNVLSYRCFLHATI